MFTSSALILFNFFVSIALLFLFPFLQSALLDENCVNADLPVVLVPVGVHEVADVALVAVEHLPQVVELNVQHADVDLGKKEKIVL